jgi:hypothetical protein
LSSGGYICILSEALLLLAYMYRVLILTPLLTRETDLYCTVVVCPGPTTVLMDLFCGAILLFLVLAVSVDCPYFPFYDLGGLRTLMWYVPSLSLTHSIGYRHFSWNSPLSPYVPLRLSSVSLCTFSTFPIFFVLLPILSPCTLSTFPTFLYFP